MAEAITWSSGALSSLLATAASAPVAGWPEPSTPAAKAGPASTATPTAAVRLSDRGMLLGGVPVPLTPQEHALMTALTGFPGRVWRREELARAVYAERVSSAVVVDVLVAALRRKLRRVTPGREWIGTVDGTAYTFVA